MLNFPLKLEATLLHFSFCEETNMPVIKLSTKIRAPIERVFDLSLSIDLHKAASAHTGEEAIAGVTSGLIGLGEQVTWRAKHLGVWQTLTTTITKHSSPNAFSDAMVQGAFKRFNHEHLFSESDGVTTMRDVFDFTAPLGLLGRFADWLFLENYMRRFLVLRNETIKRIAESDEWKQFLPKRSDV